MTQKTNFSFEVHYLADSSRDQDEQDKVIGSLQTTLQQLLAAQDREAEVVVSNSQKGSGNKMVELTTTLADAQLAGLLKAFSEQHGVSVRAFE